MDNNNLGLKYYSNMEDAPLSIILIQARIKTENQLMVFYDSICQVWPDTVRSTGYYIVFYWCGTIDHCTYVPGAVAQSSSDSEYNSSCTAEMALASWIC